MWTADSTTENMLLNYFPEHIQAALRNYSAEIDLPPNSVVQFAIGYFLESADIEVGGLDQIAHEVDPAALAQTTILAHLPYSMQKGIEQYAAECEFPPEYVVELAITFLLDPDASGFEDCQTGIRREQVYLLKQYQEDHQAKAA